MKKLILLSFIPFSLTAQQTITSVMAGNASSPLTWDCFCLPTTDDHVIVNHAVNMDVSWAVTAGGSITVNASGSLMQTGVQDLLVDGLGSQYLNYGTSSFNGLAYTNGATGSNAGHFAINTGLYVCPTCAYNNSGLLDGVDSLLTEGTFTNSGDCFAGNFLNTGLYNNTGHVAGDSVGNTGTFNSSGGYMYFNAFGNSGTFNMTTTGFMDVVQNWFNIGTFNLASGLQIYAHNDFFNGDTIGGSAFLTNNGLIEIGNGFFNGYSIDGTGKFCVADETWNSGTINGTVDICDNTGGAFELNLGTIAGTVTYCQSACNVGLEETTSQEVLYPNPTAGIVYFDAEIEEVEVYDLMGQLVKTQVISNQMMDMNDLSTGAYYVKLKSVFGTRMMRISLQK